MMFDKKHLAQLRSFCTTVQEKCDGFPLCGGQTAEEGIILPHFLWYHICYL